MWTRQNLVASRNFPGMIGERLHGGALGFALGGDDIWKTLDSAQQAWVIETLTKLNNIIYQRTGTMCATWGPSVTAAGGCFQGWFNANMSGATRADGTPIRLRTDGVFDQDTLDALRTVAALEPTQFPTPFPGTQLPGLTPVEDESKLSKGAIAGIAVGGAAVLGGIIWAVTRKKK